MRPFIQEHPSAASACTRVCRKRFAFVAWQLLSPATERRGLCVQPASDKRRAKRTVALFLSALSVRLSSLLSVLHSSNGDAPLSSHLFSGGLGLSARRRRNAFFLFAGTVAASALSSSASAEAAQPHEDKNKGAPPQGLGGMRLVAGSAMMPRPDKVATGGEDAFFIAADGVSIGVADGVGGWGDVGVDPAQHSRLLMSQCRSYCEALASTVRDEEAGAAQPPMDAPEPPAEAASATPADPAAAAPAGPQEPQVLALCSHHDAVRLRAAAHGSMKRAQCALHVL